MRCEQSTFTAQSSYIQRENFPFLDSVVFNSSFFRVKRDHRPVRWEEVYRCTSVCKSGRFCCHNTANSPLHHLQHRRSSWAIYETLNTCSECTHKQHRPQGRVSSLPPIELLLVSYNETYSSIVHILMMIKVVFNTLGGPKSIVHTLPTGFEGSST